MKTGTLGRGSRRRPCARGAGGNTLDYDRLAEEMEDLGSERLHACESWIIQIFAQFLKLQHSAFDAPKAGWRREILTFQLWLKRRLTATLRARLEAELGELYADAVALARASFEVEDPATMAILPGSCPFTLADALRRETGDRMPA